MVAKAGRRPGALRFARMPRRLLIAFAIAAALAAPASAQTTNPLPPVATSSAASNLALTSATVAGTVDANGSATTWVVEYGTTTPTA